MKNQISNRRKTIEIYFILYLAALVMLIPDAEKDTEDFSVQDAGSSSQLPFELKPEKYSMNAVFMMDSVGIRQISFDSLNKIYYTGNPNDVSFDFIIEDLINYRQINLDNNSQYFRTRHHKKEQYVEFLWQPPPDEKINQSFNVIVKADFKYSNQSIKKRTEFTLNKNFINSQEFAYIDSDDDSAAIFEQIRNSLLPDNLITLNTGEINLIPLEYNIKTVAYSNWSNVINTTGIDLRSELLKNPEINIEHTPAENGGTASIKEINSDKLIIGGKAPEYGSMTVKVTIVRASDSREASVQFGVLPQPIGMPEIPNRIFPYQTYRFNPNLPILSNQKTSSALKDEDGNTLVDNSSGGEFSFTPSERLSGEILIYERYIDDELFGQKYEIPVGQYPAPSFSRIQKINDNKIRVFTKSFGLYDGEENYIEEIRISGNAEYTELIGQARFDESEMLYTQVFEFNRVNPDKPFEFTATGINRKGEKTKKLIYPQK